MTALLVLAVLVPFALFVSCLDPRARRQMPRLLVLAPLPALAAAFLCGGVAVQAPAPLRLALALDPAAALLLGGASLLWSAAGAYARAWFGDETEKGRFVAWWLLTLTGSIGVFIAADLVGFYLMYSLVSLAAYGLVVQSRTAHARRAATLYVGFALLGEALLLMGFVLLAQSKPGGGVLIADAVAALPASPWRGATLLLLLLGFALKIATVPLHVWMPATYRAAPTPAAAVLSGAAVKAGVIGLLRFLPFSLPAPGWGEALAAFGLFSAFYGVAVGLTQRHPKTVLAYSSISQMGVIAGATGMALSRGQAAAVLPIAFYALHHLFAKGGLFLAVGIVARGGRWRWLVLGPALLLSLSLGGLPPSGGALAKLVLKAPLGDGMAGLLGTLSGATTTLLMLHFTRRLAAQGREDGGASPTPAMVAAWLLVAVAALAAPWLLVRSSGLPGASAAFEAKALWDGTWPVLLGLVLTALLWRLLPRLPRLPQGDILVAMRGAAGVARRIAERAEALDRFERRWDVAGVSLLAVALLLGLALAAQP